MIDINEIKAGRMSPIDITFYEFFNKSISNHSVYRLGDFYVISDENNGICVCVYKAYTLIDSEYIEALGGGIILGNIFKNHHYNDKLFKIVGVRYAGIDISRGKPLTFNPELTMLDVIDLIHVQL